MGLPRIRISRVSIVAGLYLIATTAPRVASFILLPVYAFVLPPDELAAYGVAVAMVQLIGIVMDGGILGGLSVTYYHQDLDYRAKYLKSVVLLSRVVALVALIPIGLLLAVFWDPLFGTGLPVKEGAVLLLLFAYLQRGNNLAGAVYRVRKQHQRFVLTKVLPASVQVVAGVLFVFVLHWGALGALAAAPLGFLCSIVVVGLTARSREHVPFVLLSGAQTWLLIARGVPLLPEELARWAQMLSLRPLISAFGNARATAEFTFSTAPAQIVSPFSEAYDQYIAPRYYESTAEHDTPVVSRLRDVTSMFMAIGAVGTILAIVLFDPLFVAFAPSTYKGTAGLAAIGMAGMTLRGPMGLLVHNMRVEDRRVALIGTVVLGVLVSYVQFFVLVRTFGAASAAWSVFLYPAVACLCSVLVLRNRDVSLVDRRDLAVTSFAMLGVLIVMLELRAQAGAAEVLPHFWLLTLAGLVGIAVVVVLVVLPRLAVTLAVVRGGVTKPHETTTPA